MKFYEEGTRTSRQGETIICHSWTPIAEDF